jgi:hypothetical protein
MTYLPVYCETCARASLATALADEDQQGLLCSFCEAPARVIPGPVYGDGDWLAFAEIDSAVFNAQLDGARATLLAEELQSLFDSREPAPQIVQRMLERLPSLVAIRPALMNQLPRGLRMLMTLLIGRTRDGAPPSGNYAPNALGGEPFGEPG